MVYKRDFASVLLIVATCAMVFSNTLGNSFQFDDEHSILKNPHIRKLENIPSFFVDPTLFSRNVGSEMYRPVVLVTYALNYWVGGYEVVGYHLVNLAVHAGVAVVFYFLLRQLGLSSRPSVLASLLFVAHPLACEPVNYLSSRSESLAAFFFIAGLSSYAKDKGRFLVLSYCCYGVAILSKSTAVGLPVLLLCYDYIRHREKLNRRWKRLIPHVVIGAAYVVMVRSNVQEAFMDSPLRALEIQLATQMKAMAYYAQMLALPVSLSVEHQFFEAKALTDSTVLLAALGAASLLFVLWRFGKIALSLPLFWFTWFIVVSLPTFIVPLNVLVNERRMYLVLAAVIGLGTWVLTRTNRSMGSSFAALAIIPCLLLTVGRNEVWATEKRLWLDAHQKAPLMTRPLLNLGRIFRKVGELDKAEIKVLRAIDLEPENAAAWSKLGLVQVSYGKLQTAEASFRRALALQRGNLEALTNLATLLGRTGRFSMAMALYESALPIAANREEVFNNMGTMLLRMERYHEAERSFRQALEIDDSAARVYFNLGGSLEGQGRFREAENAYMRAIEIDPIYAKPYYNLALLKESNGKNVQALNNYRLFVAIWDQGGAVAERAKQRIAALELIK